MSLLLTIPGMIGTSFILGLLLGVLLPRRWKTIGWVLAALAALYAALHHSTEWADVFFAALWAAIGAFPGAALGSWLRQRMTP